MTSMDRLPPAEERRWRTAAELDDSDSEKQIATLELLIGERWAQRAQLAQDKVDIALAERAVARWLRREGRKGGKSDGSDRVE